jgi:adenylate kinase
MTWDLPISVKIGENFYNIRDKCNFKVILDCLEAIKDDTLSDRDRALCALYIFYEDFVKISELSENEINEAVQQMYSIIDGDNKTSENSETLEQVINTAQTTSPNYVVGKVVGTSYLLGLLVYAVKQPLGIILIIILPCVLIIGYEVIKIVKMFSKDKKAKAEIEHQETLDELEKLKRELALLKGENKSEIKSNEITEETSVKGE